MGKFKSWKYRGLFKDICISTCLLGASAGLIFGVSAGTFKVNYIDLNSADTRVKAANSNFNYYSQNIKSQWNMDASLDPNNIDVTPEWWAKMHDNAEMLIDDKGIKDMEMTSDYGADISSNAKSLRHKYACMVLDGATHSTMDRSFNQGLYNGMVNFVQNKNILSSELQPETENDPTKNCARSFKPGADNTTEFINIYNTAAKSFRVVGLAGFNHVTPLNALGKYDEATKLIKFDNPDINKTAFLLIDGDVANNQNVGSVLFRADQPAFLAAISACMYFYNNLKIYHAGYRDISIGLYGGTSIPTVTIYMGGAQRGIEFFNEAVLKYGILKHEMGHVVKGYEDPLTGDLMRDTWADWPDADKLHLASKYKEEIDTLAAKTLGSVSQEEFDALVDKLYKEYSIKQIKLGDPSTHFSGTFAAGDAIGITKQYLNRGASAIMAVAGPQSLDTAQEIQNQNSNCIVIGVDSAMEDGDYQRKFKNNGDENVAPDGSKPAQKDNIIKFSAVKDMTSVTTKFSELCATKKNFNVSAPEKGKEGIPDPEKSICGIGYKTCGNIQNGLISISWDGFYPFVQAMRHIHTLYQKWGEGQYYQISFDRAWANAADYYVTSLSEDFKKANPNFVENVSDASKLMTYDKKAWNGEMFKNYNHIMSILGEFLRNTYFKVNPNMTVVEKTDSTGKVIGYEQATETKMMTILDWLKVNMYFSN